MGFLDKVKEKAGEALESGKEVAQTQQLKLALRKLEDEHEAALQGFGAAAYEAWAAGTLSMSTDLGAAASAVKSASDAIAAKKAEIAAVGDDAE